MGLFEVDRGGHILIRGVPLYTWSISYSTLDFVPSYTAVEQVYNHHHLG